MKSIGINEHMHKRLKILSIVSEKKIYQLILDAIEYLEEKYRDDLQSLRWGI